MRRASRRFCLVMSIFVVTCALAALAPPVSADEGSAVEDAPEATEAGDRPADVPRESPPPPPGRYEVVVTGIELAGEAEAPLSEGESAALPTSGELRVGAVRGRDLIDAKIRILRASDRKPVAFGRTSTVAGSNFRSFTLAPGRYRVEVKPVEVPGESDRSLEVRVEAGGTTTVMAEFGGG